MTEHVSDEQLSLLLDGELSLTAREAVRRHLAGCAGCAARHDQLVEVAATLRLQPSLAWTQVSTGRVLERLQQPAHTSRRSRSRAAALIGGAVTGIGVLAVAWIGAASVAHAGGRFASLAGGGLLFVSPRTLIILAALALVGLLAYPLAQQR